MHFLQGMFGVPANLKGCGAHEEKGGTVGRKIKLSDSARQRGGGVDLGTCLN